MNPLKLFKTQKPRGNLNPLEQYVKELDRVTCKCHTCHIVLKDIEDTECHAVYKYKCPDCEDIGYFDFSYQSPMYVSESDFVRYRDHGFWDEKFCVPRTQEIVLPKGYSNVSISFDRCLIADDNSADEIKIPLIGNWKIFAVNGKNVILKKVL